jgi:DNA-binding NarL/FixJ family response regulator
VESIGIVLVDMPKLLRDIVKEIIRTESDLRVLGEFPQSSGLFDPVRNTGAEVVVTAAALATPDRIATLLREHPRVRVVALTDDGERGELYESRPHRIRLTEVSAGLLVRTIRASRRPEVPESP